MLVAMVKPDLKVEDIDAIIDEIRPKMYQEIMSHVGKQLPIVQIDDGGVRVHWQDKDGVYRDTPWIPKRYFNIIDDALLESEEL